MSRPSPKESKHEQPKSQLQNTQPIKIALETKVDDINPYDELIRSLPEEEREDIIAELDSDPIITRANLLCTELARNKAVGFNLDESRTLFLAALRNLKCKKISAAQLATLHILDSAIRTLYTKPMMYLVHKFVDPDRKVIRMCNSHALPDTKGIPTSITRCIYHSMLLPKKNVAISALPLRMQQPPMKRFFNFTDSEWNNFCSEMTKATPSEQMVNILIPPAEGCYSSIISRIQKLLKCMRVLDRLVDSEEGIITENIMLVPSFSMFQAAINAKAHTLGRKSVELIATYGYVEPERYANLKASGKIALAIYMPEKDPHKSYRTNSGRFRTTIDGHPQETAFAGAIHDVYHALREISMSENVANARWRLALIARSHINNKLKDTRSVEDFLVDGELIHTYPLEKDTIFDHDHRPPHPQKFGEIFNVKPLKSALHQNLKRAFIGDMVVNKTLWKNQFNIGRSDLLPTEQAIFDELNATTDMQAAKIKFFVLPQDPIKKAKHMLDAIENVKTHPQLAADYLTFKASFIAYAPLYEYLEVHRTMIGNFYNKHQEIIEKLNDQLLLLLLVAIKYKSDDADNPLKQPAPRPTKSTPTA